MWTFLKNRIGFLLFDERTGQTALLAALGSMPAVIHWAGLSPKAQVGAAGACAVLWWVVAGQKNPANGASVEGPK